MKKSRYLMVVIFCLILSLNLSICAMAEEIKIVDGSVLTNDVESKDEKELTLLTPSDDGISLYGVHLGRGISYIQNRGNGVVYISGETYGNHTCDTISVSLYLERLVNGSWQTVSSRSHTASNTYYTSYGIPLAVKTGYYYRVRGLHIAVKNGVTESTTTATSGLYIG